MPPVRRRLELFLPGLSGADYQITSDADDHYNCIAWALHDTTRRWDPYPAQDAYWPSGVPLDDLVETFMILFEQQGFEGCETDALELGTEKIALFADDGIFTHVARQLPNGRWTSKLGNDVDIEHDLEDLIRRRSPSPSYRYGEIVGFMRRPRP